MNFTTSKDSCGKNEKLSFKCIFCSLPISAVLGDTWNVRTHLNTHAEEADLVTWLKAYDAISNDPPNKYSIDNETMKIVRYFISRNSALSDFDSESFRDLLSDYKREIPCSKTFSTKILDNVYEMLLIEINKILNEAFSVCLISDIWTSKQMLDFMGVAANIINSNFEKETIVIGLQLMPGCHNAEHIKEAIQLIVNKYTFNKVILSGM